MISNGIVIWVFARKIIKISEYEIKVEHIFTHMYTIKSHNQNTNQNFCPTNTLFWIFQKPMLPDIKY